MDAIVYDKVGKEAEKVRNALYGIYPQETITDAAIASFDDGADGIPVQKLAANIEPAQDLHGYDHPWPGGSTANLLQATPYGGSYTQAVGADLKTSEAMEYSFSSDLSTINVVSTTAWRGRLFATAPLDAGTYTTYNWTLTQDGRVSIYVTDGDLVVVSNPYNQSSQGPQVSREITVSQGQRIAVFVGGTVATTVSITGFMVFASTATASYVPFENICPISGWTGAEISGTGINVWDEQWEVGDIKYADGNDLQSSTHFRNKGYIPIVPNIQYYLKSPGVNLYFYDKDKNYLGRYTGGLITGVNNRVFTAPNSAHFMRLASSMDGNNIYNHDISINYPETDTEYHPYTGSQISVTFPSAAGTVYGGTLTINPDRTGTLVVEDAAVTFNGSEDWSKFSNANPNGTYFGLTATVPFATDGWGTAISNIFTPAVHDALNIGEGFYWSGNAYQILYGAVGGTEELANFKAFLTEHNATIVAKLAAPITYTLTAEQVSGILTTLYGTNNIWADTGNIKKLTYRADLGKFIDSRITTAVANALNA